MMRRMCRSIYRDLASESATTVLLSSGRSGSTWLGDALQSIPQTRMIFEPFHPKHGVRELADNRYQFLQPADSSPVLAGAFSDLLEGRIKRAWCDQFNPTMQFTYRRRLLKEVRINLLLPWLTGNFPNLKYFLLLRHPAAVVQSQLLGGWNLSSERLHAQQCLDDDELLRELGKYKWPTEGFVSNMIFWAMENLVAVQAAIRSKALIVFYESLCRDPASELKRIEQYLECAIPESAMAGINRASWSSSNEVGDYSLEQKIGKWRGAISTQNLNEMLEILEITGLKELYGDDLYPNEGGLAKLGKKL